jgi:hypothetical protein
MARAVTAPAAAAGDRPFRAVAEIAARAFGVRSGATEERSTLEVSDPQRAVFALDFLLNESNLAVKEAVDGCGLPEDRTPVVRAATGRALETVSGGKPSSEAMATAMRAAMGLDRAALVRAALHFDARLDVQGKGYLLRADLVQRQVEFLVSEDPDAPGNHYFDVINTAALSPVSSGG